MSTWVFLRGLTRESRHWSDFPATFQGEIPDAGIVTLDLPGNGRLNGMRSPTSVAAMAGYCRTELLAQGIRPPYYLLAMSLGAIVAVAWADKHPDEIEGCVLINTSMRPFSPFFRRLRPENYAALLRLAMPAGSAEARAREETILHMTSKLAKNRPQIVETWSAWQREHPVSRSNALRQLWAASRYRAPAHKPDVRMLVLASAGDTLVDPRCSQRLAHLWQTDFAAHPAAGHDIPLDDGAWVARQVHNWLPAT